MQFRQYAPRPELADAVRLVWTLRDDGGEDGVSSKPQPVPPDGCIEVVFNFADPVERLEPGTPPHEQPRSLLVGEIHRPLCVRWTGRIDLMGIRFAPGQGATFLDVGSTADVVDRSLALDDVAAADWRRSLSALFAIGCIRHRVERAQEALLRCLRRRRPRSPEPRVAWALGTLEREGGRRDVDSLALGVGVSARQLERRFRACTGATPKSFAQVFRFQEVLRAIARGAPSWADVAASSGYFDQAHLIRDFKRFTTMTPRAYLGADHPLADRLVGG